MYIRPFVDLVFCRLEREGAWATASPLQQKTPLYTLLAYIAYPSSLAALIAAPRSQFDDNTYYEDDNDQRTTAKVIGWPSGHLTPRDSRICNR